MRKKLGTNSKDKRKAILAVCTGAVIVIAATVFSLKNFSSIPAINESLEKDNTNTEQSSVHTEVGNYNITDDTIKLETCPTFSDATNTNNTETNFSDNSALNNHDSSESVTLWIDSPGAVYQAKKVSFSEAQKSFGHSLVECKANDFAGYSIGSVSKTGNASGTEDDLCIDIIYHFTNGKITICDQNRLPAGGNLYTESPEKVEYKNAIFMIETQVSNSDQIQVSYYPTKQDGLAYIATFDKEIDKFEIFDLILSMAV